MSHGGAGLPFAGHVAGRRLSADDAERLIDGHWAHPEAPAEQHVLAALFDSAAAPATDRERAGEAAAVAAFMLATGDLTADLERPGKSSGRRAWVVTAAIVAVSVAGFSGAAAARVLPGPVQELAHRTFDAPAPGPARPSVPALVSSSVPGPASTPATVTPTPQRPARGPSASASVPAPASATVTAAPVTSTGTAKGNGKGNEKPKKPKKPKKANGKS